MLGQDQATRHTTAADWLRRLGLGGFEAAYPHQLSGGMRQRVAIARAFATDPVVLICDEAFGHLDEVTARDLRTIFLELVAETGKTAIFVTHDIGEAIDVGHRLAILGRPGQVLWEGAIPALATPAARQTFFEFVIDSIEHNRMGVAPATLVGERRE